MDNLNSGGRPMPAAQRTCGERAPRISDDVWAKYKDKIRTLWKDQGLTVDEVLRNLEQNDGFRPSQQQFKVQLNKWDFRKNKVRDKEPRGEKRAASPDPEVQRMPRMTRPLTDSSLGAAARVDGGQASQTYGAADDATAATQSQVSMATLPIMNPAAEQGALGISPDFFEFAAELWSKRKGKTLDQGPEASSLTMDLPHELPHESARGSVVPPSFESNFPAGIDNIQWPSAVPPLLNHPWGPQHGGFPPSLWNWGASPSHQYSWPQMPPVAPMIYPPGGANLDTVDWHNKANRANAPSNEQVNIMGTEPAPRPRPRPRTSKSRQAIHQAVQAGCFQTVEMYIDHDPNCVHLATDDGITPLFIAAQGGYINIVKLLLSKGVDVDRREKESDRAPIHQAAQNGHFQIVKLLLDKNSNHDPVDIGGRTPLWSAAQEGYDNIVDLILARRPNVEAETIEGRRPIHQAAQNGHLRVVELLLGKGAQPDPIDDAGVTPLWAAAQQGHHEIVQLLVDKKARLDVASHEGSRQPMHQAAQNGNLETVKILIEAKADPTPEQSSFDTDTPSPFWLACASGKLELVQLLLDKGADVNFAVGRSSKTALHAAAYAGRTEVAELLLKEGCDIDAKEEDGWTALLIAAQEGHLPFLNFLLDEGANIEAAEKDGATALWIASQQGRTDIVRRLLQRGAKQLPTRSAKRRPIHQAAQNGHLAAIKMLLGSSPGDINATDKQGATALLLASQENKRDYIAIVKLLLSKGAKTSI